MLAKLTVIMAVAAVVEASTPSALPAVGPHLAAVRSFSATEGEKLWTGYASAPFGFLLVTDSEETLLCHDPAPDGFTAAGKDTSTGCDRHSRARTGLPGTLLAAMPIFGPPGVIVMGTPQSTGRTEASWVRTILHEHFHQWQYALPDYFNRTKALGLHDGDETGMWVLNYAFPYENPVIIAAFTNASAKLAEAVKARGTPEFPSAVDRYIDSRKALARLAGERNWRYLDFQLWQEGVARWTEIQLGKAYDRHDVRESARKLEEATIKALASPDLVGKKREVVYAHGAAEAMLLEACGLDWRAAYPRLLALGPILEDASKSCTS